MQRFLWTPGENMAVVSPNGVIVLEPGHDTLGPAFWQALEEGVDLGTLLQFLTSAFAADLASLPNFAAMIFEGSSMHIAVRGAFEVTVAAEEGTFSFTSGTVITWAEQRVHNVRGMSITAALNAADTREDALPHERIISSGVVPAATLAFGDLSAGPTENESREEHAEPHKEVAPSSEDTVIFADDAVNRTRGFDEDDDEEYGHEENDFSDMFSEHTLIRSVEDAAVRHVRNDDHPFAPAATPDTPVGPLSASTSLPRHAAHGPSDSRDEDAPQGDAPLTDTVDGQEESFEPEKMVESVPWESRHAHGAIRPQHPDFFIDAVPGRGGSDLGPASTSSECDADKQRSQALSPTGGGLHDHDAQRLHDGFTLPSYEARDLQRQMHKDDDVDVEQTAPDEDDDVPTVMAALCVDDHPNPTHAQKCRICDGDMGEKIIRIPRPSLGTIVFSTGERILLDRDIVIGRRPRYTPQPGRPEAHVVPVPSPNLEISRTHCEIKIDGWDARVRDLGSNNGTFLLRPNQQPVRVTDSAPVILRPGDVLDIGDEVTLRMEV